MNREKQSRQLTIGGPFTTEVLRHESQRYITLEGIEAQLPYPVIQLGIHHIYTAACLLREPFKAIGAGKPVLNEYGNPCIRYPVEFIWRKNPKGIIEIDQETGTSYEVWVYPPTKNPNLPYETTIELGPCMRFTQ